MNKKIKNINSLLSRLRPTTLAQLVTELNEDAADFADPPARVYSHLALAMLENIVGEAEAAELVAAKEKP